MAAFQALGGFISTFADPNVTGLFFNEEGVLMVGTPEEPKRYGDFFYFCFLIINSLFSFSLSVIVFKYKLAVSVPCRIFSIFNRIGTVNCL